MLIIDGSTGEGGGQMLRTALVWSLLTQKPFRMERIRAGRDKPGLKAQHLHVLQSLRPLGGVGIEGAREGSSEISFQPAPLQGTTYRVDIGTAGSITLLLQTLLPVALWARGRTVVDITGGTDVAWSPTIDFLRNVVLGPAMKRARHMRMDVVHRGFYPRGGGHVRFEAEGWNEAEPFAWEERGRLVQIRIFSRAAKALEERRVAERQAEAAADRLKRHKARIHIESDYHETASMGSVVTCVADFAGGQKLGGDALGERAKRAEDVGREAADILSAEIESGAPVDEWTADQLIVWLALAGGAYRASRISEHTRTNIWVTEQFLGPILKIDGVTIRCESPFRRASS